MEMPVLSGSHAAQRFEKFRKVALIEETARVRNLLDGERSLREKFSRMIYAYGRNVLSGRD